MCKVNNNKLAVVLVLIAVYNGVNTVKYKTHSTPYHTI
jgi:hypothetical protein